MINRKEIESLVYLLDDTDEEVINHVEGKLLTLGPDVIPLLESEWGESINDIIQNRLENIIHRIQMNILKEELDIWQKQEDPDLFDGACLIAKYRYPHLDKQKVDNDLNNIKLDVWLEMHYDLTPMEKVRILNHVVYVVHGLQGNTNDYHAPQNSFINQVLESKKGNPISLAVVYSLVAQKLNIPIFGVNLPQHFVLAYLDDTGIPYETEAYNAHHNLDENAKVFFYINAFNNGAIISRKNIDQFLNQIHLVPRKEYMRPCSNIDIVKRMLRNLLYSYDKLKDQEKMEDIKELLLVLGEQVTEEENHDPGNEPGDGEED